MTINKKIVTSLVASALIVTASYAQGTFSFSSGKEVSTVASELFELPGVQSIPVSSVDNNLTYNANFKTLDYGQSVSNPKIYLKFDGNVTIGANDVWAVIDANASDTVIAKYTGDIAADGSLVLNGLDSTQITNGKSYVITTIDAGDAVGTSPANTTYSGKLNGNEADFNNAKVTLSLWTGSGTQVNVDDAVGPMFATKAQYSVACENKFDNLINVENASLSFVTTRHGIETNTSNSDMNSTADVMAFKVTKTAVDYGIDGNGSMLAITSSDANLSAMSIAVKANVAEPGNLTTLATANISDFDLNVTDGDAVLNTGNGFDGNTSSENVFTVQVDADANRTTEIKPTQFTANFYINYADYNTTVTPKGAYTANAFIGEWKKFAYIAQVSGAEVGGPLIDNLPKMQTRFYITNRSCAAAAPTFNIIKNGVVTPVTMDPIPVDTQVEIKLKDIYAAANMTVPTDASEKVAVEITIPGNAEDFYVYAQVKNRSIDQFKDLPVYNTSTRSY